jgi:gliding motility-associated lipoprotein GldH
MSRRNSSWAVIATLALLLTGCIGKTVYHHYEHTPAAGWEREDTLTFAVAPMKQHGVVQRAIGLRTTSDFPFRSVSLVVEQVTYPSGVFRRDTVECTLADAEGRSLGDGISLKQQNFPLPDISLNEGDSLSVAIRHIMRLDPLPGITDVGLLLQFF